VIETLLRRCFMKLLGILILPRGIYISEPQYYEIIKQVGFVVSFCVSVSLRG